MSATAHIELEQSSLLEYRSLNPVPQQIDNFLYMGAVSKSQFVRQINKSTWFVTGESSVSPIITKPSTSSPTVVTPNAGLTIQNGLTVGVNVPPDSDVIPSSTGNSNLGKLTFTVFNPLAASYQILLGFWIRWRTPTLVLTNTAPDTEIVTTVQANGNYMQVPAPLYFYIGGTIPGYLVGGVPLPAAGVTGTVYIGSQADLVTFVTPTTLTQQVASYDGIQKLISYTPRQRVSWTQNLLHNLFPYHSFKPKNKVAERYDTAYLDNFMQYRIKEGQYDRYSEMIGNVRELFLGVTATKGNSNAPPTVIPSVELQQVVPFSFSRAQMFKVNDDCGNASTAWPVFLSECTQITIESGLRDWRDLLYLEREFMQVPAGLGFAATDNPDVFAVPIAAVVSGASVSVGYNKPGDGILKFTNGFTLIGAGTNPNPIPGNTFGDIGVQYIAPAVQGSFYPVTRLMTSNASCAGVYPAPELVDYTKWVTVNGDVDTPLGYIRYAYITPEEICMMMKSCTAKKRLLENTVTFASNIVCPGQTATRDIGKSARLSLVRGIFVEAFNVTSAQRGLWSNYSNVGIKLKCASTNEFPFVDPSIFASHNFYPRESDKNAIDGVSNIVISYGESEEKVNMPGWYFNTITPFYTTEISPKMVGYHWYPWNLQLNSLDPNGNLGTNIDFDIYVTTATNSSYVTYMETSMEMVRPVALQTTFQYVVLIVMLLWRIVIFRKAGGFSVYPCYSKNSGCC